MNFGLSFVPTEPDPMQAGGNPLAGQGGGGLPPLQRAIQLLSLRLPRIGGAGLFPGAIAPGALLNAPGWPFPPVPPGGPAGYPGAPPQGAPSAPPRVIPGEDDRRQDPGDGTIPGGIRPVPTFAPPSGGGTRIPFPRVPRTMGGRY